MSRVRRSRRTWAVMVLLGAFALSGCLGAAPTAKPAPDAPETTTPNAAAAVAYAKSQVGKPYCYAGVGPTCFDCSGLTSMAWKAGGVTLPRTSGGQFLKYPKVPLNQLQPGDLLFPADPNQHVGIYIGANKMVHATKPGSTVKEVLLSSYSVTQAVRPA